MIHKFAISKPTKLADVIVEPKFYVNGHFYRKPFKKDLNLDKGRVPSFFLPLRFGTTI